MTTILTDTGATSVDTARAAGDDLWLPAADLPRACGWTLKPEGLCQGEMCVPLPRVAPERYHADGAVNLAAFWRLLGRPVLHDASGSTWMLGAAASDRGRALNTLEAPDFTLPDIDGHLHSLSDFRGKRVFLTTWSSW